LDIEVAKTNRVLSPYVFYVKGDEEEVPVYCDWGKDWNEERIYNSIRSVVYALSFLLGLMVGALAGQPDSTVSSAYSCTRGPRASLRSSELLGIPQTANRPAEQVC